MADRGRIRTILWHPAVRMFVVLQLADLSLTLIGLSAGAVEKNAFAAWFAAEFGPVAGLSAIKVLGAMAILIAFVRAQITRPNWPLHWLLLHAGNVFYGTVVINNMLVILAVTRGRP